MEASPVSNVILAGCITLLLAMVEVLDSSKARPRALLNLSFLAYFLLLCFGNIVSTLAAYHWVIPQWDWITSDWCWSAFVGVFAFELVIQQINVTFGGNNAITIREWVAKASDVAVASTNRNHIKLEIEERSKLAQQLLSLPEEDINGYLVQFFGGRIVKDLNRLAAENEAIPHQVKAQALARKFPQEIRGALKRRS
ncbi:MAG: hypothetical protein AAF649_01845 [Verrucomicrobiota bacterium]